MTSTEPSAVQGASVGEGDPGSKAHTDASESGNDQLRAGRNGANGGGAEHRPSGAAVVVPSEEFPDEIPIDWASVGLDDDDLALIEDGDGWAVTASAQPVLVAEPPDEDDVDQDLIDALSDDDDDYVVVSSGSTRGPRGKLKARKVRRIVRYVSPWSVFKVSLLFNFCMWVVFTVAGVILWQVAAQSGQVTNFEKFLAKLLAESSYTINGRDLFRAFSSAGVVLVFAGTGFMVLMSLLFNVICDITGGVRFTVLELESTRREIKTRRPDEVEARAASGEFLQPVNRRGRPTSTSRSGRRRR